MQEYTITSLFSGCGGLDLGFKGGFSYLGNYYDSLPFKTVFANDIDKSACLTYSKNLDSNIVCEDINNINISMLCNSDILLGGFPCQDFSHAGKRKGMLCKRGTLYLNMCKVIKAVNPKVFVAENVKGLLTIDKGNAINTIISDFKELGYDVSYQLFNVSNYGVPQKRERILIIGIRNDLKRTFDFDLIVKNKATSVYDAICDIESIEEGSMYNHYWSKAKKNKGQGNSSIDKDDYAPTMRAEHHGNIEFHWNEKRRLSAREAARIQSFPDNFIFYPSTSSAYRQIGNAVPPVFAWHIANALKNFLDEI